MQTRDLDTSAPAVAPSTPHTDTKPAVKTHPAPPMIWLLLPVALLALLTFLSR
ncbi:MAG TPA: hypothetical protein VFK05_21955 [Polyangiaceae bacterium]|nr:hypothetical protein [Polyangiaceae bacterium]